MDKKIFLDEQEKLFQKLKEASNSDTVDSLRLLYSLYGDDMVDWFANLYDTKIGGYYYSNSARDNETVVFKEREYKLLPDAESTCQALGFISNSGISRDVGGYPNALPKWACELTANYIYSLQDPDGYFYHPQWGKEIGLSRRSRDFNWCLAILNSLGKEKKYPTILDKKDEEKKGETLIPDHLSSKEKFLKYLEDGNIAENSYSLGNQLSCQGAQIKAMGLAEVAVDYLNAHQHPECGHWHSATNYLAVNGVMKITGFYQNMGKPIPNAYRAAESAMNAIISDEPIGAVVDLWNTWEAVSRIRGNLLAFGGEEGKKQADAIALMLRESSKRAIGKSYEKISPFKKPDGGFSYKKDASSATSQGMPVAIKGLAEGDVNATVISSAYMLNSIYSCLGLSEYKVPMFGEPDRLRYVEILKNNKKK